VALVEKTTHVEEARRQLAQQFRDKANIEALLAAFVDRIQDLEAVLFDLGLQRDVDAAEGAQLDGAGDIVGEAREGRADVDYRIAIKARIAANLSSGTVEDVILVLLLALSLGAGDIFLEQLPPAAFRVQLQEPLSIATAARAAALLRDARAAGVGAFLEFSEFAAAQTFTFSDSSSLAMGDTSKGFADATQTTGGHFAGAILS
jgi:hypothetical protein